MTATFLVACSQLFACEDSDKPVLLSQVFDMKEVGTCLCRCRVWLFVLPGGGGVLQNPSGVTVSVEHINPPQ